MVKWSPPLTMGKFNINLIMPSGEPLCCMEFIKENFNLPSVLPKLFWIKLTNQPGGVGVQTVGVSPLLWRYGDGYPRKPMYQGMKKLILDSGMPREFFVELWYE